MPCYNHSNDQVAYNNGDKTQSDTLKGWIVGKLQVTAEFETCELWLTQWRSSNYSVIHYEYHSDNDGDGTDQEIKNDVETSSEGEVDSQILVGKGHHAESQVVEGLYCQV